MKTREEVAAAIIETVEDQLGVNDVKEDSVLATELGADSIDMFELAMYAEENYHIDIPDEEVSKLITVGDLVTRVYNELCENTKGVANV